jgi:general secretion pathway protein N
MSKVSFAAIGLSFYVATLIIHAPATLIDAELQEASNGRLRLAQAEGTIWSGTGLIEIRDAGSRSAIAKDIAWRVLPESLWRGRLICEIYLERTDQRALMAVSLSDIEITNANINLPAEALVFAEPRLKPLKLSGDVQLRATNLSVGRGGLLGRVTLKWLAAGSAFSTVSPIGSYELRLDGQGHSVTAALSTLEGPLQIDGSGSWTNGKALAFHATVLVPPQYRQQLVPLLRLISVQRDEGSFELQLQ